MDAVADPVETIFPPIPAAPTEGRFTPTPYSFEFTGEDNLRLTVVNSQPATRVAVHYRTSPKPGQTQAQRQDLTPTSDRVATTVEFGVGDGYLLNVSVFASSAAPRIGQTFVKLQVIRGRGASAMVLGTIVQGYVTANQDRAWPGSPLEDSISGGGVIRFIVGTDPAAGVEIVETVPTGARWQLLGVGAAFVADATAISRAPRLDISAAGTVWARCMSPASINAGASAPVHWFSGAALAVAINASAIDSVIPNETIILDGGTFSTSTVNLQAGDNWGPPSYTVREWLEVQ